MALLQRFQCVLKLAAVIIDFHHLFDPLKPYDLFIGEPPGIQHFIRRTALTYKPVLLPLLIHIRTFQYFQETKLQLIWFERIHIIEGSGKALQILMRQPGDQIQMLMNVLPFAYPLHRAADSAKVHPPADLAECIRIRRLHSYLKLHQPRAHSFQNTELFFIQEVRRHLEVEIRNSPVMLCNITPYGSRVLMPAIERPVYELHLRHFPVDQEL